MPTANIIQKANLKMKDNVLNTIKLKIIITKMTVKLMTDSPNINRTKAESNNAPNSNITVPYSFKKNAKPYY
ncbi:MAG: hypothetical protein ACJAZP_004061 [Psychromonas sp.]|jgi:hypothetical protein